MKRKPRLLRLLFPLFILTGCLQSTEGIDPASKEWTYYNTSDGLAGDYVTSIFQDRSGLFWFGHDGEGVTTFNGRTFDVLTTSDGLTSNNIMCIQQMGDGTIMLGTTNGVSIFSDGEWSNFPILDDIIISALFQEDDGKLWLGTYYYGILYIENGVLYQLLDNTCGSCNTVFSFAQTPDRHLWIATGGGLKEFDGEDYELYTTEDGLAADNAYSLKVDEWGSLWIGSKQSTAVTRYRDGGFEEVSLKNDATNMWVTSIASGKHGELWFGMVFYGATRFDGAVMHEVYKGPSDNTVTTMFKDSEGNLWFGTLDAGVSKYSYR